MKRECTAVRSWEKPSRKPVPATKANATNALFRVTQDENYLIRTKTSDTFMKQTI